MKNVWFICLISIVLGMVSCSEDESENKTIYTVTFDADDGIPVPAAQRVEEGETVVAPTPNPVKTGYVFFYWHLGGSTTAYNFQNPVNGNITLYAKWQEESAAQYWQITWNLNGGLWSSGDNHATQVLKGGTLAEPAAPMKTGNTFDGWYKEAALTNKITFPYDVSSVTGNITLYAKWRNSDPEGNTPIALYIAGTDDVGGCYWKVDLATGNTTKFPLTLYGEANGIVVSGSDIYVSGFETSTSGNDKACYWKNGQITFLNLELQKDIAAYAITMSGNDIYVVGREHTGNGSKPCYWKNSVRTNLSTSAQWAGAKDIFVSGADVYIAGWEELGGKKSAACYWKNGSKTSLTNGQTSAEANTIFVLGADVYTAGRERKPSKWTACYWKNTTLTTLTNAVNDAWVNNITVSNGKIYAAGIEDSPGDATPYDNDACYWENGQKIILEKSKLTMVNDIAVSGKNVYAVGCVYNDNTKKYISCYWKNGVRFNLSDGSKDSEAISIALSWE